MSESPLSVRACFIWGIALWDDYVPASWQISWHWQCLHDLSDQFVRITKQDARFKALFEPDANHLEIEAIAPVLQQLFYELVFFPPQATIQTDPGKAPVLLQLWQGLTGLIRRWTSIVRQSALQCGRSNLKTFLTQEPAFSTNLPHPMAHSSW